MTFHQSEMRTLLSRLNDMGVSWIFTDLVKCFVWQGNEGTMEGRDNFTIATSHCSKYLQQQLDVLKPKVIIAETSETTSHVIYIENLVTFYFKKPIMSAFSPLAGNWQVSTLLFFLP